MNQNLTLLLLLAVVGCNKPQSAAPANASGKSQTLLEARQGFTPKSVNRGYDQDPIPEAPSTIFRKVKYGSPVGELGAFLSPDPGNGKKFPAIIWITGGDCNSIDEVWKDAPAKNDQTAAAYRKAVIIMMFPSLRGGNTNPGTREGYFGEVQDILAAADFLAKQPYVDPARIYLGGHSTGGTLSLLVSECSDRFRAVFSFGPVEDVSGYGEEYLPFNHRDAREVKLRSPIHWLHGIKSPTFVIEGGQGNIQSLQAMARVNKNSLVSFISVKTADHFNIQIGRAHV